MCLVTKSKSKTMDQEMDFCVKLPGLSYPVHSFVPLPIVLYNRYNHNIPLLTFLQHINGNTVKNVSEVCDWFKTFYDSVKTKFIFEMFRSLEPVVELLTRHKLVEEKQLFKCHTDLITIKSEKELLNYNCCFCRNSAVFHLYNVFKSVFDKHYLVAETVVKRNAYESDNHYALNLMLCIQKLFRQSDVAKEVEKLLCQSIEKVKSYVLSCCIVDHRIQLTFDSCCVHRKDN